jgi:hypothetical protein
MSLPLQRGGGGHPANALNIASRRAWRDRRLMALLAHKKQMAATEGD